MGATIITTSINYILLYISYRRIKEIAEVVVEVEVLRDGSFMKLPSTELVPGDIFIPKN
jgi:magnesium-transporting ATPase (P-type)